MNRAFLILAIAAPALRGIIVRHDRPSQDYLDLGARHPAVCRVGTRMGDGTLIGGRWVLTAAHVARGLVRRGPSPSVYCGDREYRVVRSFRHPKWSDMGPHDIGVLELEKPVTGIKPLELYRRSDEAGRVATIVGHGRTGVGNSPERHEDGRKRGATNRIEEADEHHLVFRFDGPPGGTELEGIPGAGDSGGPALLEENGELKVAGVSSKGRPGPEGPGSYGALDYFTRVSRLADWVDRVLAGRVAPEAEPAGGGARTGSLPDSAAGRRLRVLLELLASGDESAVEGFVKANVTAERPLDQTIATYRRLMTQFRGASLRAVMLDSPDQVDALVATPGGERIIGVRVSPDADRRITGVLTGRP